MLVLRCTQKLLTRISPPIADPPASTTALGDWCDQPLALGRQRQDEPAPDHTAEAVRLSRTPVSPLGPGFPGAVTLRLLGCDDPRRRGRAFP